MRPLTLLSRLVMLCLAALTACAPPSAAPVTFATLPLPPAAVTAAPERPTVPAVRPTPLGAIASFTTTLSLAQLNTWEAPPAYHIDWLPDGQQLAVSGASGVYIYDAATLDERRFLDLG